MYGHQVVSDVITRPASIAAADWRNTRTGDVEYLNADISSQFAVFDDKSTRSSASVSPFTFGILLIHKRLAMDAGNPHLHDSSLHLRVRHAHALQDTSGESNVWVGRTRS